MPVVWYLFPSIELYLKHYKSSNKNLCLHFGTNKENSVFVKIKVNIIVEYAIDTGHMAVLSDLSSRGSDQEQDCLWDTVAFEACDLVFVGSPYREPQWKVLRYFAHE